ncbi:MAG: hypothetical protein U9R28_09265 [Pseudomonadota bacterium]|nr:hypothetical protein [Pseudomonadota bacterium]
MNSNQEPLMIGQANNIEGEINATDSQGNTRSLQSGDPVFLSDTIATPINGSLEIIQPETQETLLKISKNTSVFIDESVIPGLISTESLIEENAVDIESLQQAVEAGLFEELEETAAGEGSTASSSSISEAQFMIDTGNEGQVTAGFDTSTATNISDLEREFEGVTTSDSEPASVEASNTPVEIGVTNTIENEPPAEEDQPEESVTPPVEEETPEVPATPPVEEATPEEPVTPPVEEETPEEPVTPPAEEETPEEPATPPVEEETPEEPVTPSAEEETPEEPVTPPTEEYQPEEPVTPPLAEEKTVPPTDEKLDDGEHDKPGKNKDKSDDNKSDKSGKEHQDNGHGNGDDNAPGNSEENNNAENTIPSSQEQPETGTAPVILLEESFENLQTSKGWHVEAGDVTGDHGVTWDTGKTGLEVQSKIVSASSDGNTHAELDAHHNVSMSTEVPLNGSTNVTLSIDVKPRDGGSSRDYKDTSDAKLEFDDKTVEILSDTKGNLTFVSDDDSVSVVMTDAPNGWTTFEITYGQVES